MEEEYPQSSSTQEDHPIICQWEVDHQVKEATTKNVDITKTTMMNTIMDTPITMVDLQWIGQGEASVHHLMLDTRTILSTQCNTENQGKDLQEEVYPQEVGIPEILEDHLKTLK